MELGDKLRDTRLHKKMTLAELSSRSGVSKSLLSQIERNITVPTIKTIQKIAKALGITMTALFAELEKTEISKPARDNLDKAGSGAIKVVSKDTRKKLRARQVLETVLNALLDFARIGIHELDNLILRLHRLFFVQLRDPLAYLTHHFGRSLGDNPFPSGFRDENNRVLA